LRGTLGATHRALGRLAGGRPLRPVRLVREHHAVSHRPSAPRPYGVKLKRDFEHVTGDRLALGEVTHGLSHSGDRAVDWSYGVKGTV
jgi:hypothetical protein